MTRLSIADIDALAIDGFVALFGGIAEHSPWVAEAAAAKRPFGSRGAMVAAFHATLDEAAPATLLALIRAHPDLAGKAARAGTLTEDSTIEQRGGGLDRLSDAEFDRFTDLNERYKARFGFPFIHAVRGGASKEQILASFETRLGNDAATEFATAIAMIKAIVGFRLEDRVS